MGNPLNMRRADSNLSSTQIKCEAHSISSCITCLNFNEEHQFGTLGQSTSETHSADQSSSALKNRSQWRNLQRWFKSRLANRVS